LVGHEGEISKVCFNPQGSRILTASSDKSARIWEVETGGCMQVKLYCTLTHFFKESTLEWLFRGREVILGTCRDSNESMRCKRMSDFFLMVAFGAYCCFRRFWRATRTRFSAARSTTRATRLLRVARTTLAGSGSVLKPENLFYTALLLVW
jgi:hypothetical protein